ncbi:MAG: hypothetical protein RL432_1088 [Bacteroidota bacterium]
MKINETVFNMLLEKLEIKVLSNHHGHPWKNRAKIDQPKVTCNVANVAVLNSEKQWKKYHTLERFLSFLPEELLWIAAR